MIKAMVIMILAGLTFLRGLPDGMAYNMVSNPSILPTPTRQPRRVAPVPTVEATPNPPPTETPTPEPTEEPTPEPTPEPTDPPPTETPEPTEELWACPAVGDCTKKEYKEVCKASCETAGLNGCGKICKDCWKEGS